MERKGHDRDKLHNDKRRFPQIDNSGYSIIELVIVLAIIAIIMSTVFYSIILIFSANARSCANNIQRSIGDCKVTTMGKADAYMILSRDDNGVYTQVFVKESDGTDTVEERNKVGSNKVEVGYIVKDSGGAEVPLMPGDSIEIRFDRSSGGFKAGTSGVLYEEIYVRGGSKNYGIVLTELTGKSEVEARPMPTP